MAYSDYGGYAYRNGEKVIERSDGIVDSGLVKTSPGIYPGFMLEEARGENAPMSWHVILGSGPIFLTLRKSFAGVYRGTEQIEPEGFNLSYDHDCKSEDVQCSRVEIDGRKIELRFTNHSTEDNYYVYGRIEEPDGTVWCGYSGYGVGAGLEDCGYGFSDRDREETMLRFWPNSIAATHH